MAILCDKDTKLLSRAWAAWAQFHAKLSIEYGTQVVAGVHPGRGGQRSRASRSSTRWSEAVEETGANASVVFVPPPGAADAILEAADAGSTLIACITEGIPASTWLRAKRAMREGSDTRLVGPNCPGVVTPEQCRIGIMPAQITKPGPGGRGVRARAR